MTRQHEVELLTTGCPARRDVSFAKTALNVLVFKLAVCLWTRCELSLERQSTQMPRKSDVCPQSAPNRCWETKKDSERFAPSPFTNSTSHRSQRGAEELPDQDSNLDKQNQNLLCYRYTIGQAKVGRSVSDAFVCSQALVTDRISCGQ